MTQFCIKRTTLSFTRRAPQERIVKGFPLFDTREEAEAWIKNNRAAYRCVVREYHPPHRQVRDTHCQICERDILANTGLIALHGYERPGLGWQTASCFGAKYRPYEIAADALPPAIANLEAYFQNQIERRDELLANPPATLVHVERDAYKTVRSRTVQERPAGFDPHNYRPDYRRGSYVSLFIAELHGHEQQIRIATIELKRLRKRLADWKAPKAA